MQNLLSWQYDEFSGFALDFHDPTQVAAYDSRQNTKIENERALVAALNLTSTHTVIEYGCGTGAFTIAAATICEQVVAVDISKAMLTYAQAKADAFGLRNIQFCQAGFLTYSHKANTADAIVTKYAFHHLPDFWKSIALAKMYRHLKLGGVLYIEDVIFSFHPNAYDQAIEEWISELTSKGMGFSRADFEAHVREEHSTYAWILEGLLEKAGFEIEQRDISTPVYASYRCRKISNAQ